MGGVGTPSKSLTDKVAIERCLAPDVVYILFPAHWCSGKPVGQTRG